LARNAYRFTWGVKAAGKPVQVWDFVWGLEDGKVAKISTIQDQFALPKQIGYFLKGLCGVARARRPRAAERGRWSASCGGGVQAQC
jgi:hypothetical protein